MTEDWNTTDELKKDIIAAVYKDINDQIEEMVEDKDEDGSEIVTLSVNEHPLTSIISHV